MVVIPFFSLQGGERSEGSEEESVAEGGRSYLLPALRTCSAYFSSFHSSIFPRLFLCHVLDLFLASFSFACAVVVSIRCLGKSNGIS